MDPIDPRGEADARSLEHDIDDRPHADPADDGGFVEGRALERLSPKARNELYEAARHGGGDLSQLQALAFPDLLAMAAAEGLALPPGLSRQELLFEILKNRCKRMGLGWGDGVLEVLPDGFGFLRSPRHDYVPGPDDIYVSPSQVRRLNLKPGHQIAGPVRPPRRGEKYLALLHVEMVNGGAVGELGMRIPFDQRTPVLPHRRLPLAHDSAPVDARLLDLLAPWGRGQRVLVHAPPASGRTLLLTHIVQALLQANPDVYAIVCVIDERPEDVTELRRRTGPDAQREVVASTFDQPPARHIALCEMALARAQRMVEAGRDVVLVLDSMTALVRAYQQELPQSGRLLAAGLDAVALQRPKRLFGAARCLEEGGSLTVITTVLTATESRVDRVIVEEFAGKGSSDVVLDQELAALHVFPALDVQRTGTRREDCLLPPRSIEALRQLRARLQPLSLRQRLETVLQLLEAGPGADDALRAVRG